jgi:PKHD-type hydroxylase
MSIYISNAIDNHSLLALQDTFSQRELFHDGKLTAGSTAREVKSNLQAAPGASQTKAAITLVQRLLLAHPTVISAVYPEKFAKTIVSRYEPGMGYGEHIDEAIINETRTDIAFTVFLSDPSSYQGGELELIKPDGRDHIKLPAGSAYLYPADTVHQVLPITKGVRLAIVGWIQSKVRLEQHRQILSDLHDAIDLTPKTDESKVARLKMLKVRSNLERLWCFG